MSIKFVMTDVVVKVEERFAKQWIRGTGKDAEFKDNSTGFYAVFKSCPAAMFLGTAKPALKEGDRVRLTLEKM